MMTTRTTRFRRGFAAAVPFVCGNLSFLARTAPVVVFLFDYGTPLVWLLSGVGLAAGAWLSSGDRLFGFEADGRLYDGLGVRRFRGFVTNGDRMVRAMNAISPGSFRHLGRTSLAHRRAYHRGMERLHWALLGGTLPALAWAAALGRVGYFIVFCLLAVVGDGYPIMLQRYSLAVLRRIERRAAASG